MSRTYSIMNKNQKHPKVHHTQYLHTAGEPKDYNFRDTPAELEAELLDNVEEMRGDFRHLAQKMRRNYYS